jgi:hypothetical protein
MVCYFAVLLATIYLHGTYNAYVFGSFWRTGYSYWCSIPYDIAQLTFSMSYLGFNLEVLADDDMLSFWAFVIVIFAVAFRTLSRTAEGSSAISLSIKRSLGLGLFGLVPASLVHLIYFYPSSAFHVTTSAWLAANAGGALAIAVLPWNLRPVVRHLPTVLTGLALILAIGSFTGSYRAPHSRYAIAGKLAEATNATDTIITAIDPVYLSAWLPPSVTIIPISRRVEYASKFVTPRSINGVVTEVNDPFDHRNLKLLSAGAVEAVHTVAVQEDGTVKLPTHGRVLVDTSYLTSAEVAALKNGAAFKTLSQDLLQRE